MAVFVLVSDVRSAPAGDEVADGGAQHQAQTQVGVVGHEHQHQAVAPEDLNAVHHRLQRVRPGKHPPAVNKQRGDINTRSLSTHNEVTLTPAVCQHTTR